jgi:esterase/lipase superfamily enzyme
MAVAEEGRLLGSLRKQCIFKNVVLTAPDIDSADFVNMLPHIKKTSGKLTLYASSNDRALSLSSRIHANSRAGEAGPNILVQRGIDTIDASNVRTDFIGHSYYGDHRTVINDLFQLLKHGFLPSKRAGLQPVKKGKLSYWQFAR